MPRGLVVRVTAGATSYVAEVLAEGVQALVY